jgi:hypothetical protein
MSDRHEKWQPVEPGHVIPTGQPTMIEWDQVLHRERYGTNILRSEYLGAKDHFTVPNDPSKHWFVDSSWRPPLELPTEATWGIVRYEGSVGLWASRFFADERLLETTWGGCIGVDRVLDFIPLTPEQVARIEQSR